jgi:peptide subunit release factor 1 (eRF1)
MMIRREDVRELAEFQLKEPEACALSFYFQPRTPQNKSHREEAILAKDLVRQAAREVGKNGKSACVRADLDRILEMAGSLHGNQARAKAVFACAARNFWREFDLPARLPETQIFVNQRFHLQPLAVLLGAQPSLCVALVDRQRGRFFELRLDELKERDGLFRALPRRRSDGYAGYDAGHIERHVANEAMQHYKAVAERLREEFDKGVWEKLVIGCHDTNWPEFEPYLHPYVRQRLLGRFSADVAAIKEEQVREQADRILQSALDKRRQELLREALENARGNSLGVTGLRRVLRALELGEVQTLFLSDHYSAHAVECPNCGHLDSHMVSQCAVCGQATRELEDVRDAIVPMAIRRDIELFYVKNEPELDRVGNIAALLRFRADQRKAPQAGIAV